MRPLLLCALAAPLACATAPSPPASGGLVAEIAANPELRTLAGAVRASGMADELGGPGPYTVFAPTDAAFAAAGRSADDATPEQLRALVRRHVVRGRLTAAALTDRASVTPLDGAPLRVQSAGDRLIVQGAAVTAGAARADNGIVHTLDAVLPPAPAEADDEVGRTTGKKGGPDAWWW